jgi:hypothetical protein
VSLLQPETTSTHDLRPFKAIALATARFALALRMQLQAHMRLCIVAILLALCTSASTPAWAGDQDKDKDNAAAKADAERRAKLRLQRNQRILTQKEIEKTVAPHVPEILQCYQTHASKQKSATGEIQLEMLIRPRGTVQRIWVRARGVKGQALSKCVQELATNWLFPKKDGFTNAVVPFFFQKTKAKGTGPLESCWNAKGCPDKKKRKKK